MSSVNNPQYCRILTVDGGGMRGIVPAVIISELEKRINASVAKKFDFMGGTSTGALVTGALNVPADADDNSSGLAAKFSGDQIVQLFKQEGQNVFPRSDWVIVRLYESVRHALWAREYSPQGLYSVVEKYCGEIKFGETLTKLVIPIITRQTAQPVITCSEDPTFSEQKLSDIVEAATAAETYFPVKTLDINGKETDFEDAGAGINNPEMQTFADAFQKYGAAEKYLLVSIGTGQVTNVGLSHDEANEDGEIEAVSSIYDVLNKATEDGTAIVAEKLLGENHYRIQVTIDAKHSALDDASSENMDYLEDVARGWCLKNAAMLDEIAQKILNPF